VSAAAFIFIMTYFAMGGKGEVGISLKHVLGIPVNFWLNREARYREYLERKREESLLSDAKDWVRLFPLKEMVKNGWVQKQDLLIDQAHELLNFFGIAKPAVWNRILQPYLSFLRIYLNCRVKVWELGCQVSGITEGWERISSPAFVRWENSSASAADRPSKTAQFRERNLRLIHLGLSSHSFLVDGQQLFYPTIPLSIGNKQF
jgi:hypothetical protein